MKTFFFTTLFRFVILAGGWIYLSSFQQELLYNTLRAANPATEAVNNCMSGMDSLSSGLNTKLDTILMKMDGTTAIVTTSGTSTTMTGTTTISGSAIKIIDNATNS